jgi:chromosomal replication initiation ATPase DnaA
MQMPSNPDIKRFYITLIDKLDACSCIGRGTVSAFEPAVYNALKKFTVKMLVIDEIHNILSGTYRQQLEFLNVLRYIGNEVQIPIICVGTKDAYLAIRSDPQLENRFEPFALPVWMLDDNFIALLASFVSVLPLKKHSNLIQPNIVEYIFEKTEGTIGECATFLKRAAVVAIQSKQEYIDIDLLKSVDYHSPSERRQMFERELI